MKIRKSRVFKRISIKNPQLGDLLKDFEGGFTSRLLLKVAPSLMLCASRQSNCDFSMLWPKDTAKREINVKITSIAHHKRFKHKIDGMIFEVLLS